MTFAPIKLAWKWSLAGGRLSKPHGLDTKDIDTPLGPVSFVKVDKNARWLLKAVVGSAKKGGLRRSTIFHTLHAMLSNANSVSGWIPERSAESSSSSAVAGAPSPAIAGAPSPAGDSMSQLVEIRSELARPKTNRRGRIKYQSKIKYKSKRGQNKIHILQMSEHEPVSHPDRTETRNIRLLPTSTSSLWICIGDIEWLVRWLSDELRSGGVCVCAK